jgi:hypothetical protein
MLESIQYKRRKSYKQFTVNQRTEIILYVDEKGEHEKANQEP